MKNKLLKFVKMAGAGNDFVIIEALKTKTNLKKLAVRVCDRTNGIGADGLIVVDKSKNADYKMRIINADGSEAEMCGNGARCFAAYIADTRSPKNKQFTFETLAGVITGEADGETAIVGLTKPEGYQETIPIQIKGKKIQVSYIDTGVPHAIIYVDKLDNIDVETIGPLVRYHKKFEPRGVNVNFVEQINSTLVANRTYERGVEDETKACGTGSVASGIVTYLRTNPGIQNKKRAKIKVKTRGGEILFITFDIIDGQVDNVWLKGTAKFIARGEYYV